MNELQKRDLEEIEKMIAELQNMKKQREAKNVR